MAASPPVILFAAHDRHNLGDLLFAHVAAHHLHGRMLLPAGLIARDLSPFGGMRVEAIGELSRRYATAPVDIIHVGGEILTTTAEQALVMLTTPEEVTALIARFAANPPGADAQAAQRFGFSAQAPYLVGRELFPRARRIVFNAVGGADLSRATQPLREEVFRKLRQADCLFVRDGATQSALAVAGIDAQLAPDPVAVVGELFADRLADESGKGEVAALRRQFPCGYIAVQFAAECGDDATLMELAAQLERIAAETGYGIVFFRAGTAPWHDDADVYRRCAARLAKAGWAIFATLDIWQITALVAASEGFLGTSLHGHIVASAHALPRISFLPPSLSGRDNKLVAYCASWEMPQMPGIVPVARLADGFRAACRIPWGARRAHAARLAALYHRAAERVFAS